jgi:hypothetical protein
LIKRILSLAFKNVFKTKGGTGGGGQLHTRPKVAGERARLDIVWTAMVFEVLGFRNSTMEFIRELEQGVTSWPDTNDAKACSTNDLHRSFSCLDQLPHERSTGIAHASRPSECMPEEFQSTEMFPKRALSTRVFWKLVHEHNSHEPHFHDMFTITTGAVAVAP